MRVDGLRVRGCRYGVRRLAQEGHVRPREVVLRLRREGPVEGPRALEPQAGGLYPGLQRAGGERHEDAE